MPNVTAPLAVKSSWSRWCASPSDATSAGWPDG